MISVPRDSRFPIITVTYDRPVMTDGAGTFALRLRRLELCLIGCVGQVRFPADPVSNVGHSASC